MYIMKLTFCSINLYEIKEKTSITLKQHDVRASLLNSFMSFQSIHCEISKQQKTSYKNLANNISTWSTTNCAMSIKRMIESVSVHTNSQILSIYVCARRWKKLFGACIVHFVLSEEFGRMTHKKIFKNLGWRLLIKWNYPTLTSWITFILIQFSMPR